MTTLRPKTQIWVAAFAAATAFFSLRAPAIGAQSDPTEGPGAAGQSARTAPFAPHVKAALVSEAAQVKPGDTVWLGLWLEHAPHWHTYWKNPGDSGAPTRIAWTLPEGVTAGEIQWPFPRRIELPPLVSQGYENEVLLLIPLTVSRAAGKTIPIRAKVDWLECEEICIPGKAELSLNLPVGNKTAADPARAELFAQYRAQLPLPASEWKISAYKKSGTARIVVSPPPGETPAQNPIVFFPSDPEAFEASAKQTLRQNGKDTVIELAALTEQVSEVKGVLVREAGWRGEGSEKGLEIAVPLGPAGAEENLLWILALAFAGGLLLNLMPCVLPVLSLKAFGLIHDASLPAAERRRQGWLYTAGVMASFWTLAGVLLALRAGGEQLGWGFHLQSPRFVIALIALFVFMTANLLGLFEVGTSLTTVGSGRRGWGSFGSGVLATVVATPCTAPFMGTAVGVALSQPAYVAVAIFSALGLGMAFPYWLLTAVPAAGRWLPKPGAWMNHLKKVLGLLLLATAAWLFWVMRFQAPAATFPVLLMGAAIAVFGWTLGLRQRGRPARVYTAAAGVILTIGGAFSAAGRPAAHTSAAAHADWEEFSPARVAALEKTGQPYFIDFTAAWCLTCQVNKRTTLQRPEVVAAFKAKGVALLEADWTNRSAVITEALAGYGRSGVPLYVLKGTGDPELLPALLTPAIVLEALEKIKPVEEP